MNAYTAIEAAGLAAIRANFALSDEQLQIVHHVDRVAREVLHPLQEKMDAEDWWPDDLFRQMGELGLLGVTAPVKLGGSGQDDSRRLWCLRSSRNGTRRWACRTGRTTIFVSTTSFETGPTRRSGSMCRSFARGGSSELSA